MLWFKLHYANEDGIGFNVITLSSAKEAGQIARALDLRCAAGLSKLLKKGQIHWVEETSEQALRKEH